MYERFGVAAALAAIGAALLPADAAACSCMPPSLSASWHLSADTVAARILSERRGATQIRYEVEVLQAYSGCLRPGARIHIETALHEATCGQPLRVGARYLLTADAWDTADDPNVFSIHLCGYNRLLSDLTPDERAFLGSRQVICEDTGEVTCADGSDPVQCLQDPCDAETCAEAAVCEANYCGGCGAEFYADDWTPVCQDPG